MKTLKINVRLKHIEKGEKAIVTHCPIALAMNDHKAIRDAYVTTSTALFTSDGIHGQTSALPKKVQAFILRFDEGKSVKPFSFNLKVN